MLAVLFAICYFMMGMVAYQFLKPDIAVARGSDQMNCSAPTTSGDKGICLLLDGVVPYAIIAVLAVSASVITEKKIG